MSSIELTCWGHAGVRLERDGAQLVVDPGTFTDPQMLEGATAVLVTHEHADHVAPDGLAAAVASDGGPQVWAPEPVIRAVADAGAPSERLHAVTPGERFTAAGFDIRVLGGRHAVIHPSLPEVANLAYLVDGAVLHPGDSFPEVPDDVRPQVLALPVSAPWMKLSEAVDYVEKVSPEITVPIHDAILSDAGRTVVDRMIDKLTGQARYQRVAHGETMTVHVA